ncbi:recombinase family protein [Waterburya agarophytonicola K14]|uniref:Recombinase family protein n=1 Tax=Waterburya agarophytonicola KI4 TaxID=2874699 RepID=A0A964FH72_9CYAN|nr:recombinase family protein [Waterburya agarophytonicola KI4]
MVTYAYLRVSTNQQDVDNQRHGCLEYANKNSLGHLEFVSDSVSGQKRWRERELGQLLTQTAIAGDIIIFAEISRMARSTLQVLEILECCMERELTVHIAKQQMVLDDKLSSRITATVLGLAAEIERELISMRTKEALAKRKASGKPLGRPKGRQSAKLKLDPRKEEIKAYLDKGISKRSIAKLVDCAPSTLYYWLERNQLIKSKTHH